MENVELDLSINEADPINDFRRIANELMNKWLLKANSRMYRITELEFYLKSSLHNDTYTHAHSMQKEMGKWYYHGSGIDITFGNQKYHGGILLRALCDISDCKNLYYYGPLNVVAELFRNLESVYRNNFEFGLVPDEHKSLVYEEPICAPRVGLNSDKNPEMYNKPYRFLIMPMQKHAEKGRIIETIKSYKSIQEINKLFGYRLKNE